MNTSLSHYELLEELGRGAFAVVYRARDTEPNRDHPFIRFPIR